MLCTCVLICMQAHMYRWMGRVVGGGKTSLYLKIPLPTHNKGHILDLVISKGLNISKVLVSDVALSDHYCVFFESDISVYTNVQTEVV